MHYTSVDAIKFIACVLVVILHAINPGGGVQQHVYLLGTYGIPLFFMVNGYLLAYKEFSFEYIWRKIYTYLKFVLIWGLIIGSSFALKEGNIAVIPKTICGSLIGKGHLYQLWFLYGLLILYFISLFFKKFDVTLYEIGKCKCTPLFVLVALSIVFLSNIMMNQGIGVEIREVIPPAFRIVTNASYYCIGAWFRVNEKNIISYEKCFKYIFFFSLIGIYLVSDTLKLPWASSLYDFPLAAIGTVCIFGMVISKHISNPFLLKLFDKSIGIWVLHPFVLDLLNRIYIKIGINYMFAHIISIFICITIVYCITQLCIKNKKLQYLFTMK